MTVSPSRLHPFVEKREATRRDLERRRPSWLRLFIFISSMKSIIIIIIIRGKIFSSSVVDRASEISLSLFRIAKRKKEKKKKKKRGWPKYRGQRKDIFVAPFVYRTFETNKWQKARSYTCLSFFCTALSTRVYPIDINVWTFIYVVNVYIYTLSLSLLRASGSESSFRGNLSLPKFPISTKVDELEITIISPFEAIM